MTSTPKSFWSYQAPEPPTLSRAIALGAINASTSQAQWEALSPGMRREIVRSQERRAVR